MSGRLFTVILYLFTHFSLYAQSWQWATSAGGIYSDKAADMDRDTAGNLYICGYYNESAVFGTQTAPSTFGKDGYLAKLDTAGNFIWLRTANGGWDERVLGMCTDKLGYVYVTGTCWFDTDFGSCSGSFFPGGADNIFVAKLDLNGNCQWLLGAGGDADDQGFDLIADDGGNVYVTGFISDEYSSGTNAIFGNITVPVPYGDSICFVSKIDAAGNFLWVRTFAGTDGERDNRITIDSLNNIYITGGFSGVQNFGTDTLTSAGDRDAFVIKYDANGNYQWSRRAGGVLDDRANSITLDAYGDLYITGEFRDKAGFGMDSINNNGGPNGRDIFVAKMKTNGDWVWAKKAGSGNGGERGDRIVANNSGNIFVTGQFMGNASFGGNITLLADSADSLQVFVAAIDTSGKWQWALMGGGTYEDRGSALVCDDSCNLYNAGYYKLNSAFGNNAINGSGGKDIYAAKIINSCFDLPSPIAGFVASTYEICQHECVQFTDTSFDASLGVEWIFQGGTPSISSIANPEVCFNSAGMDTVYIIAKNANGTDTFYSVINVHPVPATDAGNDTCIMAGNPVVLTATGGDSYLWNTGDTTASILVTPYESTIYNVIATIWNCVWVGDVSVKVQFPASISGDSVLCYGETVQLTASQGNSYWWSTGEISRSVIVSPPSDSIYSVIISRECDTVKQSINIKITPNPAAFAGNDTIILSGTTAQLYASGGTTYLWSTGETTPHISVSPETATYYAVTVRANGCAATDSVLVDISSSFSAAVPSVFSPNGDGYNDKLFVRGYGIKEINFIIYNRWGEKVFETADINSGWDGTFRGKPCDPSVFVYLIRGQWMDGSEINVKGNVTLLR